MMNDFTKALQACSDYRARIDRLEAQLATADLAALRVELDGVRAGSAKVCRELRAENAALRAALAKYAGGNYNDFGVEARAVLREELADARLGWEIYGFDRQARTITLKCSSAIPNAAIGEKWHARAALAKEEKS